MSTWTNERHDQVRRRLNATDGALHLGWDDGLDEPMQEVVANAYDDLAEALDEIERLRAERTTGEASDGYHTHNELYRYRMLYNAHATVGWVAQGIPVVKSWRHADGELCFGGGWFIVTATLPTGQVSNHYEAKHWDLFDVPWVPRPPEWDGHTPDDAADRLEAALNPPT